ncbi:MAG: hypothetical protein U1E38_04475 [Rhodospirillales bacterium]
MQGRGAADAGALEDDRRGDLGESHRLPRPQRPGEDHQAVLRLYNLARMHVTTVLSDKYMAMVGEPGGKDWASTKPA